MTNITTHIKYHVIKTLGVIYRKEAPETKKNIFYKN